MQGWYACYLGVPNVFTSRKSRENVELVRALGLRGVLAHVALLTGCMAGPPVFCPYSALTTGLSQLTPSAREVHPGDVERLAKCRSTRLGDYLFWAKTYRGKTPADLAAVEGGTHIVLVDVDSKDVGTRTTVTAEGDALVADTDRKTITTQVWRVYRVEANDMTCLPRAMRPNRL